MTASPFPPYPPGTAAQPMDPDAPRELRPVIALLLVNLALSVAYTVASLVARHSLVDYQLDHRGITDPQLRAAVQHSYVVGIVSRAIGNVVVSVVYVFLVRALVRGRRWAYRRVLYLGGLGILGLVIVQLQPYPAWVRVEQGLQILVLAGMLAAVSRPAVRAHFDPSLPGRDLGRFRNR